MNGAQNGRVSIYVDESGRGRPHGDRNPDQPWFIVGVLVTNRADTLTRIVNEVCDDENYRREMHWREDFNNTARRVYMRVMNRLNGEHGWEYKATRFAAEKIDFRHFGGDQEFLHDAHRMHYVYNRFVREGIQSALRYSAIDIPTGGGVDIVVDEKARTREDNFITYLEDFFAEKYPRANVTVRDPASETERLIQVCDIISGAHNSLLVRACGPKKLAVADHVWMGRCKQWEFPMRPFEEAKK